MAKKGEITRYNAAWYHFRYVRYGADVRDPRPTARKIKQVMESPSTPHRIVRDIETGVHIMMLCAGKLISRTVPYDIQYLSACQLLSDFHAGLVLATPEEVDRFLALARASMIVEEAVKAASAK